MTGGRAPGVDYHRDPEAEVSPERRKGRKKVVAAAPARALGARSRRAIRTASDATDPKSLAALVSAMAGRRILVHADLVVDEFVMTGSPRPSREAPVLILEYKGSRMVPGGGANAAANIAALGGIPVVVGEVGEDDAGRGLVAALRDAGADVTGILVRAGFATPRKTRIMAGGRNVALQQVVRIDRIEPFRHDEPFLREVKSRLVRLLPGVDGVLVSDYGLGFVDPESVDTLILGSPERDRMKVALDSRHRLFEYAGVDVATPSEQELEGALGRVLDTPRHVEQGGREALDRLRSEALVVTRGSLGMLVLEGAAAADAVPPFGVGTVADVTGAGDTVIAALSLALAAGLTYGQAARLANAAAGIKVTKLGTATVSAQELRSALSAA